MKLTNLTLLASKLFDILRLPVKQYCTFEGYVITCFAEKSTIIIIINI